MLKNKKGQEEIVGFVVIVVIVCLIGVILLGIALRQKPGAQFQESSDVAASLQSMMQYTTDCALNYEPNYLRLSELIQECFSSGNLCTSGKGSCKVLNMTLATLLGASYPVGEAFPLKGYELTIASSDSNATEELLTLEKGTCEGSARGAEVLLPSFPGTIVGALKVCS